MYPRGQKTKARGAKTPSGSPSSKFLTGKPPFKKENSSPAQTKTSVRNASRSPNSQPTNYRPIYVVKTSHGKAKKHAQASGRTKNGKLKIQSSSSDSFCDPNTSQQLQYQSFDTTSDECLQPYKPLAPSRRKEESSSCTPKKEASGQTKIYSKPPNAPPKIKTKKPKMTSSYTTTTDQQIHLSSEKKSDSVNRRGYEESCSEEGSQQVQITSVEACVEDINSKNSRNIKNLTNVEPPRLIMPNRAYISTKTFGDPCLDTIEDYCNEEDEFQSPMVMIPDQCTKAIGQVDVDCIKRTTASSGRALQATTFTVEHPSQVPRNEVICNGQSDDNVFNTKVKKTSKEMKSESVKPSPRANGMKSKEQVATTSKYQPKKPDISRDTSPSPSTSKKRKIQKPTPSVKKPTPSVKKPVTPTISSTNTNSNSGCKLVAKSDSKLGSKTTSKSSLKRTNSRRRFKNKKSGWNPKHWTTEQKVLYGTIGATILVVLGGLGLYYAEIIDFDFLD